MVVQHNLTAMNANRMLGITTKTQAKATEKLSSGYRINRAADDAAGLAISEKMRKQIRGLTQASSNAQDGISAVQTAEGALTEVHDMIQRMSELATKSANGTNSQEERDYIQLEVDALIEEIDRVSETTKFNDLYLLKGGDSTGKVSTPTAAQAAVDFSATYKNAGEKTFDMKTGKSLYEAGGTAPIDASNLGNYLEIDSDGNTVVKDGKILYGVAAANQSGATSDAVHDSNLSTYVDVKQSGVLYSAANATAAAIEQSDLSQYIDTDGHLIKAVYSTNAAGATALVASDIATYVNVTTKKDSVSAGTVEKEVSAMEFNLHVGAEGADTNKINVKILKMDADTLGVKSLSVKTEDDATAAIDKLNASLKIVSEQRAQLGAAQNRLEHTINNLDNVVENTTAAESQIRDTDMATQMVQYSNNNILAQAGQAMLAQANQTNQGVLSLLG